MSIGILSYEHPTIFLVGFAHVQLVEAPAAGEAPEVKKIAAKTRGRLLLLGELDVDVQQCMKTRGKAGTPVSVPVVLAAAEGVIMAKNQSLLSKYGGRKEPNHP